MLTAAQRAKCQRIAEALDRGERISLDGFSPQERGEIWDSRQHVRQLAERRRSLLAVQATPIAAEATDQNFSARTELRSLDLDYWAADDVEPDDDDEPLPVDDVPEPADSDEDGDDGEDDGDEDGEEEDAESWVDAI
jgi:hypothetical protein